MKKLLVLLTVLCLLLIASVSVSFAAPFLVCDPATGVDNYQVEIIDNGGQTVANPDVAPDPSGTYGFQLDLEPLALPDGSYTVRATASNMWGTSNWSTSYPFVKSATVPPVNIRLVPNP